METSRPYTYLFEKRPYSEDSTPEEIQALKDHVFIHDPHIIYYHEIWVTSPFSVTTMFNEVRDLGKKLDKYGLLFDVRKAAVPDSITRREINKQFVRATETVEHVAFCSGQNILINAAARFVMHNSNLDSFSIHKTIDAAEKAIKDKIDGRLLS